MEPLARGVAFTGVVLHHIFEDGTYHHLDLSLASLTGLAAHGPLRFKLTNRMGHQHIEFRRLPEWPEMFEEWPGKVQDQWGDYFLFAGDLQELDDLTIGDRRLIIDIVMGISEIAEVATANLNDSTRYITDARNIRMRCQHIVQRELEIYSNETEFKTLAGYPTDETALKQEVRTIEDGIIALKSELKGLAASFGVGLDQLPSLVAELMNFRKQIPQILNVTASANAAIRIVADQKAFLDLSKGSALEQISGIRHELEKIWATLDIITSRIDEARSVNQNQNF